MSNLIIYILLISILHSIVLFNNDLGINVLLLTIPIILVIVSALKNNNKIKNIWGLLFIVPIIVLSSSFLVYDNSFKYLNILVLPILYIMMYIYTINPVYKLSNIIKNIFILIFAPFSKIGNLYNIVKIKIDRNVKLSNNSKSKIKSFLIVLPIVLLVFLLLKSADMVFDQMFFKSLKIFDYIKFDNIIGRIIRMIIFFTYFGCVINYISFAYKKDDNKETIPTNIDTYTIKLLLTILNIVYIVFDIIQVRSLLFHHLPEGITYAEYARSGFFQLVFISILNLIIILLSKRTKKSKYINIMSLLMILLTSVIIASSAIRMFMYEQAYGYTVLRLLVYVLLFTEALMLIPTVAYIINPKIKIMKQYIIIVTIIYSVINLISVDKIIAINNISRYYRNNKIDIDYLENYNTDNIPYLYELYNNTNEIEIRTNLEEYFDIMKNELKDMNIFEYNISKNNAKTILNKK